MRAGEQEGEQPVEGGKIKTGNAEGKRVSLVQVLKEGQGSLEKGTEDDVIVTQWWRKEGYSMFSDPVC